MGNPLIRDEGKLQRGEEVVKRTQQDVEADLGKLRAVIDDLVAEGWHGKGSIGFRIVMEEWDAQVKKLMAAMSAIAKGIGETNAMFTINDEENQNLMQKTANYSGVLGQRLD